MGLSIYGSKQMREIISAKNEYVRFLRRVRDKDIRSERHLCLIEGIKCVQEALASSVDIQDILLSNVEAALLGLEKNDPRIIRVSARVIEVLSEAKTPQGVIACASVKPAEPVYTGLVVALDRVSDPQNVGSIIRSADAAGACGVMLSENCADYLGQKAIRSSMGSVFHLPVAVVDLCDYLKEFSRNGTVIAGDLKGTNRLSVRKNTCVVIGNEAHGISEQVKEFCDQKYKIPIYGRAESLNAGVAAGIMLYKAAELLRSTQE